MEPKADLRAEFIASSWLDGGLPADQILLRPLGDFKRRSHQDIAGTHDLEIGNFNGRVIESNRSGIYDHLPEQLFHLPSSNNLNTTKKRIDEIRFQREKEQRSRLFFLPFEQEFFYHLIALTRLEHNAWELAEDSGLLQELRAFWQAPDTMDATTFVQLLPILPQVSEHRGDLSAAAEVMSAALRLPVAIHTVDGPSHRLESMVTPGDSLLGSGTLLGGLLDNYLPDISIEIEVPEPASLDMLLNNTEFDILVHWLLGWFLPVEYNFTISLTLPQGASGLWLAADDAIHARLGYTTLQAG